MTSALRCQVDGCANRVTCIGAYEGAVEWLPACDEHCGHGCEDGQCVGVGDADGLARALIRATSSNGEESLR
jgi:hypothetical protein